MIICAVIITFNRLDKLKIALECYEQQLRKPEYILVVNNASTDGTFEFLEKWKEETEDVRKIVIHNKVNTGGSGGYYTGFENAMKLNCDWIWVADDDAYPEKNSLKVIADYIEENADKNEISAVCGQVLNNGITDIIHRRNHVKGKFKIIDEPIPVEMYKKDKFEIQLFSYVGTVISKKKLEIAGLTNKDYFIQYDDTEHSIRLNAVGKIICLPAAKIIHDQPENYLENLFTWKYYYSLRNRMNMIKDHFSLNYYVYECTSFFVKIILSSLKKDTREYSVMAWEVLKNSLCGKRGMHETYKPGWKPNNKDSKIYKFHK